MFEKTFLILMRHGLDHSDITMIRSGDVDWDLHNNDLLLFHRDGGYKYETTLSDDEIEELLNVSKFESQSDHAHYKSDVFASGNPDDWTGVARESNWEHLTKVYSEAVKILGDNMSSGSAEPYLFMARHSIELWLKAVIMLGQDSLKLASDLPGHHDLQKLWTSAYPIIRLKSKASDIDLEMVDNVVKEYHKLDPKSFAFRYPVTKSNETVKSDPRVLAFSRVMHAERFASVQIIMEQIIRTLKFNIMWTRVTQTSMQKE